MIKHMRDRGTYRVRTIIDEDRGIYYHHRREQTDSYSNFLTGLASGVQIKI